MWYDKQVVPAYKRRIDPAIQAAGYKPVLIKNKEHINKIDDEITAEINRSAFLIAQISQVIAAVFTLRQAMHR